MSSRAGTAWLRVSSMVPADLYNLQGFPFSLGSYDAQLLLWPLVLESPILAAPRARWRDGHQTQYKVRSRPSPGEHRRGRSALSRAGASRSRSPWGSSVSTQGLAFLVVRGLAGGAEPKRPRVPFIEEVFAGQGLNYPPTSALKSGRSVNSHTEGS